MGGFGGAVDRGELIRAHADAVEDVRPPDVAADVEHHGPGRQRVVCDFCPRQTKVDIIARLEESRRPIQEFRLVLAQPEELARGIVGVGRQAREVLEKGDAEFLSQAHRLIPAAPIHPDDAPGQGRPSGTWGRRPLAGTRAPGRDAAGIVAQRHRRAAAAGPPPVLGILLGPVRLGVMDRIPSSAEASRLPPHPQAGLAGAGADVEVRMMSAG
jgi:hypothetical protein